MSADTSRDVLRIGNCSGFYGDRFDAMTQMLTGGRLDVLTGDYLAELTMLILGRDRTKDPERGYARTFLRQLETGLQLARDNGVRIVTNAGGLNPEGLARSVAELGERLGVPVRVGCVTGDDLTGREWHRDGVLTANAYLGGGGIAACLDGGADVVVTGRVTDAALVSGAAAAHFGWAPDEFDALAGAVVAGHVLECGAQATGGNYAFFTELQQQGHELRHPGFPLAEIARDGSSVITKHPGAGGAVTTGTVTAQLLYETAGARYPGPDVTARLDSVQLQQDGPDRVRVTGVRGEPPPPQLKVGLSRLGGWRNEVVFVLTGLDIDAKAALVQQQLADAFDRLGRRPADVRWTLARTDRPDADVQEEAAALLRLVVRDPEQDAVGRPVTGAAVELALASYPGFQVTAPPAKGSPYGVFETAYTDQGEVPHCAALPDGTRHQVSPPARTEALTPVPDPALPPPPAAPGPVRRAPLGELLGARSGDKGGDANLGVWVRGDLDGDRAAEAWAWLVHHLTVEQLTHLLPETRTLTVTRHLLPNLHAVNFVIEGLLGEGVAAQARFDPQAKALGEWLRSRQLDIPERLLP